MFYVEGLLSKQGPLAKVWLAANLERKLSKSQVLQSDIGKDVNVILNDNNAPMALRLHGNLMLGVVRIYGKKAKYLQDDCHEALLKIRMTFKNSGNHDLPANATTGTDLNLPELLTIDDLFPAMDFAYPMSQKPALEGPSQDFNDDWTSSLNPNKSTQSRLVPGADVLIHDDDLNLDFGDNDNLDDTTVSIQQGRNAPADRDLEDDVLGGERIYKDDDLVLDFGEDGDIVLPTEEDAAMPIDDDQIILGDDETAQLRGSVDPQARRATSPLSEVGSEALRDLDNTFNQTNDISMSEIAVQQKQRSKKFKAVEPDIETVLHNREIKAQSEDRSKILKPAQFLPRDSALLTLMNMQKNGDFVTNAMNDGISRSNYAPELQGLLSFDVVFRSSNRKRKRDSGIGGLSDNGHSDDERQSQKSPRLDLEDDEGIADIDRIHAPIDELNPALEDMVRGEDDEGIFGGGDEGLTFDDTTVPLVHPADSGPVSLGTKRAVHLLRERLGDSSSPQSSQSSPNTKKSVLLTDLVPERRTTKEGATKMFFEVLVLATKDAVKVEQSSKEIGLPLRIRGKRGLWGSWAEDIREEEEAAGVEMEMPGQQGRVVEVAA